MTEHGTKQSKTSGLPRFLLAFLLALPGLAGAVAAKSKAPAAPVHVKVLAFNDLHGRLSKDAQQKIHGRPVGSAAVLAACLKAAAAGMEDRTLLVEAGDLVGASPAVCALLREEPAFLFLNLLADADCTPANRMGPDCNLVGTVGNHEFDKGVKAMLRLVNGGDAGEGMSLDAPYPGARFPVVCCNVVDARSRKTILPPHVVKRLGGVSIGIVGAVTKTTPNELLKARVAGLDFLDEADAVNRAVKLLRKRGVRGIVVLLHQGGNQEPYDGPTDPARSGVQGKEILDIVSRLDAEVDVVISGHTHAFSNALLTNAGGRPVLLTQAFSYGRAFAEIDLSVDPRTRDIVAKTATLRYTYADEGPGMTPDPEVAAFVARAEEKVRPITGRLVGKATGLPIQKKEIFAGESALGDLIADAHRAAGKTDFAFTNPTGIRADLVHADVTWGDLFATQPFQNALVRMELTGEEIGRVLRQQWGSQYGYESLQVSGLRYAWRETDDPAGRIVEVRDAAGNPLDPSRTYTVTVNEFLAQGGNGFNVFRDLGRNRELVRDASGGEIRDVDALADYIRNDLKGAVAIPADFGQRVRKEP
ncbi:MAG: bifunctional metallophosphatase/5'-nucleotidase [Acidobacteria bacterium]|nr:bifunctional metallophosphatase/5'-nucleotidase [Acidobacteriota bacterium]